MPDLAKLIAELEGGSIDLANCISLHPDLSHEDQLLLAKAEQRWRFRRGDACNIEHYKNVVSWLAEDPKCQRELIAAEFALRLGSAPDHELLDQFLVRYCEWGTGLSDQLRGIARDFRRLEGKANQEPIAQTTKNETKAGSAKSREDLDLTGSFISPNTVGDARAGRYVFARLLGRGKFGAVYLAQDMELKRQVAVKVPNREALEAHVDVESYLVEAQTVAMLDHPHIVPIYDVGRTHDGSIFVVTKFINGCSLAEWIKTQPLDHHATAKLLEPIAEALHHAHQRRLIHRDIKPANILIEEATATPFVADFGLAVREEDYLQKGYISGTPAYMSPEQIRGEGHRLDGRSDLFSLGVVMYQMLTGHLPFQGRTREEVTQKITSVEPVAPSSIRQDTPIELERICLKLLRKRISERYANGRELAEDLRAWLAPRTSHGVATTYQRITPRGLRSFTAEDASYFLDLLPGPRNRDGLPESIAFWKERIEQRDPDLTFTVGLLYGPSGCGKSSLVKAGLIPHLAPEVIAVYVESTPEETESRLLRQLRKRLPELPPELGLAEIAEWIRRSEGSKVVLILDQFEQWLHSHRIDVDGELLRALRQCDGGRLQSILMIRDDFYLAAVRLMNQVDVPIVTDQNFKLVDLFDKEHARRVLIRFGEYYERLPRDASQHTFEQQAFLRGVVDGLSENNHIVPVRLSLLAELLKGRDWVPSTLEVIGGLDGLGISFLEETFASSRADARHRVHQEAARGILRRLLPEVGADIKGSMRSEEELLEASGYANRRQDFQDLMRILDGELRMLTPTHPEGQETQARTGAPSYRYFQLTHDYLVPSLREWLTRKQRESKKGRAELRLAERAGAWSTNPETKQLPTLWEWLSIWRLTESSKWRAEEKALMSRANRYHMQRNGFGALMLALLIFAGVTLEQWYSARELDREADNMVAKIETADFSRLADELPNVIPLKSIIKPKLQGALDKARPESLERLKLSLAMLIVDPRQVDSLVHYLTTADTSYVRLLIDQLRPYKEEILDFLWDSVEGYDAKNCLPVASALADYDASNNRWREIAGKVSEKMVTENPLRLPTWIELLRPVATHLNPELARIHLATPDSVRSQSQIDLATEILGTFAAKDFDALHELILTREPNQFAKLFPYYEAFRKQATERLRLELARRIEADESTTPYALQAEKTALIARQANAAVALLRLEDPKPIDDFLTVDRDPEALSQFIFRIRGREISPLLIMQRVRELSTQGLAADTKPRQQQHLRLYGMVLGLGEFTVAQLPTYERVRFVDELIEMYRTHPSRAVHSALGWLLQRWGQNTAVRAIDETPLAYDPRGDREWYVVKVEPGFEGNPRKQSTPISDPNFIDLAAPIYFTMLVFPGGEFEMRSGLRKATTVSVPGPLAVSDREVTWRQFSPHDLDQHRHFCDSTPGLISKELRGRRLSPNDPVVFLSFDQAIYYCRWLTAAFMPGEENQCYGQEPVGGKVDDPAQWEWLMDSRRRGFRMLTKSEWEYVATAGMETQYSFGTSESLLGEYAWYRMNSGGGPHRTGELRPSIGGLFDVHGNVAEWTSEKSASHTVCGSGWDLDATWSGFSAKRIVNGGVGPTCGFRIAVVPVADGDQ